MNLNHSRNLGAKDESPEYKTVFYSESDGTVGGLGGGFKADRYSRRRISAQEIGFQLQHGRGHSTIYAGQRRGSAPNPL